MSPAGYIGIDLGTSAVKVLVQDEAGAVHARASRAYPTSNPRPGWAEQNPEEWWQAVGAAVREAMAGCALVPRALGLSGQLNGFVLLGDGDRPLHPAVIWLDLRAEAEARDILENGPDVSALSGNTLSAICVLPKLVWMRRHRPEAMAATRRIALAKDFILLRLTGELATDPSDAGSTALATPGGSAWAPELCARAGIEPAMLPTIRASGEPAGHLSASAAEALGLPAGLPVATGAGDVAALAVGCGIVAPGRVAITLGTAGHVVAEAPGPAGPAPEGTGLWRIPHALEGRGLWLGLIMAGGLSLSWLRGILAAGGPAPAFERLEALAAESPPGARGLSYLPFLEGAATPQGRPDARGAFLGLSSAHGAGDMIRAVMEGVAHNARECVAAQETAGVAVAEVRLAEGGAQLPLWCQVLADALGREVALIGERDTSAAGAAILAHAAADGAAPADVADASVRLERRFAPDAGGAAAMAEGHARYREACARLLS